MDNLDRLEDALQRYAMVSVPAERGFLRAVIADAASEAQPEVLIAMLGAAKMVARVSVEVEECKRQIRLLGGDI